MEQIIYQKDLPNYGRITIEETTIGGEAVRWLKVDDAIESVMYLDPDRKTDLFSDYLNGFNWIFQLKPALRDALLIGGGGFAYPKHFLHHHPSCHIDVAEISGEMVTLAREYFGLDELMREYPEQFGLFVEDGMQYLKETERRYDVILNDAYIGRAFSGGLQSHDGMAAVKEHLREDGIYVINLVTAPKGIFALGGNRLIRRLQKHFKYTFFMTASEELSDYERQNCLVFASDHELGM